MNKTRQITQYQYQCSGLNCGHIWWSNHLMLTRCPNCTARNTPQNIQEGQEPRQSINPEHQQHKTERQRASRVYRLNKQLSAAQMKIAKIQGAKKNVDNSNARTNR